MPEPPWRRRPAPPDPPYWRERPAPDALTRLGTERWLLLTSGPLADSPAVPPAGNPPAEGLPADGPPAADSWKVVGRPVRLADGRLVLVAGADPELARRLAVDSAVTLTPCDHRGGPRPARPFDAADPVASSRRAEPAPARARPSPADTREALIRLAPKRRFAGAVDTLRRLLGRPAPAPLVLELVLAAPS